jgi:large subunit ribosomal protein L6
VIEKKVAIPDGVTVEADKLRIMVKGPKGELEKDFDSPVFNDVISIGKNDAVVIKSTNDSRKFAAMTGTICSHIKNMILGVTIGFRYKMKIFYSHFPMSISVKDGRVEIKNFLGEKGARTASIIGNTSVKVAKDELVLEGINIEDLGQTCANIEQACKIGRKDRRVYQDGIYLSEKSLQSGEKL